MSDARSIATAVLERVWRDGAWAAPALDAELARAPQLDRRDAALATELVYGVLRTAPRLEQELARHATRSDWRKDAIARATLLVAAYSLCALDRVPAYAAVGEAVAALKAARGARVGGFANAVLRKLAQQLERAGRPDRDELVANSVPPWLRAALAASVGDADALVRGAAVPALGLCLATGEDRAVWIERLHAAAPQAEIRAGAVSPRCILLRGAGDVRKLPGHGVAWQAQEEGAQVVALAVGARAGEIVLDACAGRGGKTWLLAEAVGDRGAIDAADRQPRKLAQLHAAHTAVRHTFAVDWARGSGEVPGGYDRVLIDAPCSGIGTLLRRPEIAERLTERDVGELGTTQLAIARGAASRLRPGGRLIYAVCSVLRAECEVVIDALCDDGLEPSAFDSEIGRTLAGEAATMRLLPHVHGTDGYFVACLQRVVSPSFHGRPLARD